jgi:oxygen-independent coproporphyrinogen III oxidase
MSQLHGRDLRSAIVDRPRIKSLIADGAVTVIDDRLSISDGAEFLVRSIAWAFDAHLAYSAAMHSRAVRAAATVYFAARDGA